MFPNGYPWTDFHKMNMDWILKTIQEIVDEMNDFTQTNTIEFADPIEWNITTQYGANKIVIDPTTGIAYISKVAVPVGIDISNTDYWLSVIDLTTLINISAFDTVSEMINCAYLKVGNSVLTKGYHTSNDGGGCLYDITDVAPVNKHYETLSNGLYAVVVANDNINILQMGADKTGSNDISTILQSALDKYKIVYISEGIYSLLSPVNVNTGNIIHGSGNTAWRNTKTSALVCSNNNAFICDDVRSFSIYGINIYDADTGISVINGSYDFEIKNVSINAGNTGIDIIYGWAYRLLNIRCEGNGIGFNIQRGTCSNIDSCIAYNSTTAGFIVSGLQSSVIKNCETDGATVGFDIGEDSAFGINSCAVEGATAGCFKVSGPNTAITFINPSVGVHSTMAEYIFTLSDALVKIDNFRIGSAKTPASPYGVINVLTPDDTFLELDNCTLYTRSGNLGNAVVTGGYVDGISDVYSIKCNTTKSNLFTTFSTSVQIAGNGTSSNLIQLDKNTTWIFSAMSAGTNNQGSNAVIDLPNATATALITELRQAPIVTWSIDSDGNLTATNTSSSTLTYNISGVRIR